jgi:hypothetical protein
VWGRVPGRAISRSGSAKARSGVQRKRRWRCLQLIPDNPSPIRVPISARSYARSRARAAIGPAQARRHQPGTASRTTAEGHEARFPAGPPSRRTPGGLATTILRGRSHHPRPPLLFDRHMRPVSIPAVAAHAWTATFCHDGIGTDRTLTPLPTRSTITRQPSRCCRGRTSAPRPLTAVARSRAARRAVPGRACLLSVDASGAFSSASAKLGQCPLYEPPSASRLDPRVKAVAPQGI